MQATVREAQVSGPEVDETTRKLRADVLLAEVDNLKAEQVKRITARDRTVYTALAAAGVVVGFAATHGTGLLLALPLVSLLLGWVHHINDQAIGAAGRYLRREIAPALAELIGGGVPVLGWESAHRTDRHRRARKLAQLCADLTAFVLTPAAALVAFWLTGPHPVVLLALSLVQSAALVGLAVMVTVAADLAVTAD